MIKNKQFEAYQNGDYLSAIDMSNIPLTFDTLIKSNNTKDIPYFMSGLIYDYARIDSIGERARIDNYLQQCDLIKIILTIQNELRFIADDEIDYKYEEISTTKKIILFPAIWPIAFGDFVIINQFIKYYKQENPNTYCVLIAPLNRPELEELAELNTAIDKIIDITLLGDEKERNKSIYLKNGKHLNVTKQEKIILNYIKKMGSDVLIYKLRYLPILDRVNAIAGKRIWEHRAELYLKDGTELPKIAPINTTKKDQICVHFRDAGYGDRCRNVSQKQAQEIIDALKKEYPNYKIVRFGDNTMPDLAGIDIDLAKREKRATIKDQIKIIQESKLFIGGHSAPQMLAIAASETPVICINYTCQETTTEMSNNIPKLSYEPIGEQVVAVLYNKMYDAAGQELVPTQNNRLATKIEHTKIEELMEKVKQILW